MKGLRSLIVLVILAVLLSGSWGLCIPNAQAQEMARMNLGILGGSVSSGPPPSCTAEESADILAETFIGSDNGGYSTAGWTTSASAPDPNADTSSLSSNKPNADCDEGFRSNVAASSEKWAVWNINRGTPGTCYIRAWFWVDSHSIASEDYSPVLFAVRYDATSWDVLTLQVRYITGEGLHLIVSGTDTYATIGAITLQTWHRLDVTAVSGGTSIVSIDGAQARSWTAENNENNYVMIGTDGTSFGAIDIYYYQLFVNTTAF